MLLHEIHELRRYPNVSDFVENHLSMQFGDVRAMLRLPLPELGIEHGCNFAVTDRLCSLISGLSVTIFMPSNPTRRDNKGKTTWIGSGEAFKQLLKNFYPWKPGYNRTEGVKALYDLFRNPFVHALGVHGKSSYQIQVKKCPLRNDQIEEIERSRTRPDCLPPGLSGSGKQWTLDSRGFYRDVFHMFWNLAKDVPQMRQAEKRFSGQKFVWREGKPPVRKSKK